MNSPATVLVIEDSPVVQHLLRATLARLDVTVFFADDGEAGLELARTLLPDVITLDVGLPGINGWQVLCELRADPATCEVRVIVLTAHAQQSMREAAAEFGADAFMTKPFLPEDLRNEVQAAVSQVRAGVPAA